MVPHDCCGINHAHKVPTAYHTLPAYDEGRLRSLIKEYLAKVLSVPEETISWLYKNKDIVEANDTNVYGIHGTGYDLVDYIDSLTGTLTDDATKVSTAQIAGYNLYIDPEEGIGTCDVDYVLTASGTKGRIGGLIRLEDCCALASGDTFLLIEDVPYAALKSEYLMRGACTVWMEDDDTEEIVKHQNAPSLRFGTDNVLRIAVPNWFQMHASEHAKCVVAINASFEIPSIYLKG